MNAVQAEREEKREEVTARKKIWTIIWATYTMALIH